MKVCNKAANELACTGDKVATDYTMGALRLEMGERCRIKYIVCRL